LCDGLAKADRRILVIEPPTRKDPGVRVILQYKRLAEQPLRKVKDGRCEFAARVFGTAVARLPPHCLWAALRPRLFAASRCFSQSILVTAGVPQILHLPSRTIFSCHRRCLVICPPPSRFFQFAPVFSDPAAIETRALPRTMRIGRQSERH
jgi:hypothetical protein